MIFRSEIDLDNNLQFISSISLWCASDWSSCSILVAIIVDSESSFARISGVCKSVLGSAGNYILLMHDLRRLILRQNDQSTYVNLR